MSATSLPEDQVLAHASAWSPDPRESAAECVSHISIGENIRSEDSTRGRQGGCESTDASQNVYGQELLHSTLNQPRGAEASVGAPQLLSAIK